MTITAIILLSFILFVIISFFNDWLFSFFLIILYVILYIFDKRRKDLIKPRFYFNGDFIIYAFLNTDWIFGSYSDDISIECQYTAEKEDLDIYHIGYKTTFNKRGGWLLLNNISFNHRVCVIINPFSFYRVKNFLKTNPPVEKSKRTTEKRDQIIDSIL